MPCFSAARSKTPLLHIKTKNSPSVKGNAEENSEDISFNDAVPTTIAVEFVANVRSSKANSLFQQM